MFSQPPASKLNTTSGLLQRLNSILVNYAELAASDPATLRSLIPANEVWRLFVDGNRYCDDGWVEFEEREPGYLNAMYTAFQAIHDSSATLDAEFIKKLHLLATRNVKETNYARNNLGSAPGEFRSSRSHNGGYYLVTGKRTNMSINGIFEVLERANPQITFSVKFDIPHRASDVFTNFIINPACIQKMRRFYKRVQQTPAYDPKIADVVVELYPYIHLKIRNELFCSTGYIPNAFIKFVLALGKTTNNRELAECIYTQVGEFPPGLGFLFVSSQHQDTQQTLHKQINDLIREYQRNITAAKSHIDKLSAIIKLVQACEQLHAFRDGNCRTLCMLLLNHLSIRNGFPFVVQEDPNRFDLFSHAELLHEIIQGMENTFTLIREKKLFNLDTNEVLARLSTEQPAVNAAFASMVAIEAQGRERQTKRLVM